MTQEQLNRFAFGSKSITLWAILVSVSVLVLIYAGDLVSVTTWAVLLTTICIPALLYQHLRFKGRVKDLLTKGVSLQSYSYKRQSRFVAIVACLGFVGLVAPLIFSGFMSADVWLGCLIGILDGWLMYLTLFTIGIWLWERKHLGVLYRLELWNGRTVTHIGLKFQKDNAE